MSTTTPGPSVPHRLGRALAIALVAGGLLAACGRNRIPGDTSSPAPAPTSTTSASPTTNPATTTTATGADETQADDPSDQRTIDSINDDIGSIDREFDAADRDNKQADDANNSQEGDPTR